MPNVFALIKLTSRSRLLCAHTARNNFRLGVVLGLDRNSGQPSQHRNLSDMRQRIGYRALKQNLRMPSQRPLRRQTIVTLSQARVEPIYFLLPRQRWRIVPCLLSVRDRDRPLQQIPDMRQNLHRRSRPLPDRKLRELRARPSYRFATAIRQGRQRVPQKFALFIRHVEQLPYRSQSPSTISILPIAATTSAISRPSHIFTSVCKLANDGDRMCTRYGFAVPSLTT
jgi:hypothetical protein